MFVCRIVGTGVNWERRESSNSPWHGRARLLSADNQSSMKLGRPKEQRRHVFNHSAISNFVVSFRERFL